MTLALAALLAWGAAEARAFVPPPSRLLPALADANRRAGRSERLAVRVEVGPPEGAARATGTLLLEPTGGAQLELRREGGAVELHRRRGARVEVLRDGRPEREAVPLLPPWEVLQAPTPEALQAALVALGVDPTRVDLGLDGDRDLWVLGGRDRRVGELGPPRRAAVWVDPDTLEVVRIDDPDGTRWRFGPLRKLGPVRLPAWVEVQPPRGDRLRIRLLEARPARR